MRFWIGYLLGFVLALPYALAKFLVLETMRLIFPAKSYSGFALGPALAVKTQFWKAFK